VRVYATALTPAQIQTDMATPVASARPGSEPAVSSGSTTPAPVASLTASSASTVAAARSSETAKADVAAARPSEPQPLRLMTWNINGGQDWAGTPSVDAQVALMVSSGAQVIALQGVTISTAGDLSSLYQWKLEAATSRTWNTLWIPAPTQLAPASQEGHLLLTTLAIADSTTTAFDSAPGNATMRDAKRAAGSIGVVVNGVTVHIATTQLAVDAAQRGAQVAQLDGWLAGIPTPRLIGGDFQMRPTDTAYGQMASGFRDVWVAVGQPGAPGFTQTASTSPVGRMDYWWSELTDQHVTPAAISIVETSRSSHHAVVIDVTVQ
ncbi:MAG: endonuclease/exonuclease/phosphatase family protein, partial [Acidobacteriota bacterium]